MLRPFSVPVVLPFLLGSANVLATERFVGGAGASDAKAGTAQAPFATLGHAAQVVVPGDVVTVRAGNYNVGTGLDLSNAGTEASPIIFRAEQGARPVITSNTNVTYNLVNVNADWVEVRGFEVTASSKGCISVFQASHVTLVDNLIHNCQNSGIWLGNDVINEAVSHHLHVESNEVYDTCRSNQPRTLNGGWPGAVTAQRATDIQFVNNLVHENWGEGILCVTSLRCNMTGNRAHDNYGVNLYFDNARASLAEGNFAYSTGLEPYFRGGLSASGLQFANEDYGTSARTLSDIVVRNNIIVGGAHGFYYGNYQLGGGLQRVQVLGNTFARASQELVHIDAAAHSQSVFRDNIFVRGSGTLVPGGTSAAGLTFDHNLWSGGTPGALGSGSDVLADPLLVDAAGLTPEAFKLSSQNSPAIGVGVADAQLTTDFFGSARGAQVDLGAHQYGSSSNSGLGGSASSGGSGGSSTTGGSSTMEGASGGNPGAGGITIAGPETGGAAPSAVGGSAAGGRNAVASGGASSIPAAGGTATHSGETTSAGPTSTESTTPTGTKANGGCACEATARNGSRDPSLWGSLLILGLAFIRRAKSRACDRR